MRASEIQPGISYAVNGQEIQLARVQVIERRADGKFICLVEEGYVYDGWAVTLGHLDMVYVSPGREVALNSRDILRTWQDEQIRRGKVLIQREGIRNAMTEMDQLLNDLGLPEAQMQLLQLPTGYLAVTVLGIEDVRKLHGATTPSDLADLAGVPPQTEDDGPRPEVPESP